MASRRGSSSVTLPSGHTLAYTRTSEAEDLPHATKKYVYNRPSLPYFRSVADLNPHMKMTDHLRRFEVMSVHLSRCMRSGGDNPSLGSP